MPHLSHDPVHLSWRLCYDSYLLQELELTLAPPGSFPYSKTLVDFAVVLSFVTAREFGIRSAQTRHDYCLRHLALYLYAVGGIVLAGSRWISSVGASVEKGSVDDFPRKPALDCSHLVFPTLWDGSDSSFYGEVLLILLVYPRVYYWVLVSQRQQTTWW
jgi:hypothetical protein